MLTTARPRAHCQRVPRWQSHVNRPAATGAGIVFHNENPLSHQPGPAKQAADVQPLSERAPRNRKWVVPCFPIAKKNAKMLRYFLLFPRQRRPFFRTRMRRRNVQTHTPWFCVQGAFRLTSPPRLETKHHLGHNSVRQTAVLPLRKAYQDC